MSFGSSPPQPPNPIATAAAQTGTNVSTAVANAYLNNTDQITSTGSLIYKPTGSYQFTDPTLGQTYNIPTFTATQSLSPTEQAIENSGEAAKLNLSGLAASQSGKLQNLLGSNFDLSGAPAGGNPALVGGTNVSPQTTFDPAGSQATSFSQFGAPLPGSIATSYGSGAAPGDPGGFEADRQAAQDALMGRLNPQLQIEKNQDLQKLSDQGIQPGSPAYAAAMDVYNRQANDARLAVIGQTTQQQQAMADMAAQKAGFQNAAQQQQFNQAQAQGVFYNTAQQAQFGENQALGQFYNTAQAQQLANTQAQYNAYNTARQQYIAEQYALRNQPINETTALLSGSQVQNPNFVNTPQYQIPTTDIAGLINTNFNQQASNYNQQVTQQNQIIGGILGAAGNIGAGYMRSDRDVKENIGKVGTVFAADDEGAKSKLPIYQYSYKDDPVSTMHVGPMAQDVEKLDPRAVKTIGGVKHIDPSMVMGSILKAA